jgi:tryptophan-rich sensory protein
LNRSKAIEAQVAEPTSDRPKASRDLIGLFAFIILCLAVSGIGGAITETSVNTWYQALEKPLFNPPDWVFAPVWTALYIVMGIAAWRVWRLRSFEATGKALSVFAVQLCLNLAWSFLFFGLQRIDLALVEIVILLVAIIVTSIMFWRVDRLAGLLFVPYGAWVTYATILNASIWLINET